MFLNYCDAPAGAGKTYGILKIASELVLKNKNVLIIQPTMELINQSAAQFENIPHTILHGQTVKGSVVGAIVKYLKDTVKNGHVVFITWTAFEQLPYFHHPEKWHLFVDEVPQIHTFDNRKASQTHKWITNHVSSESCGPIYSKLAIVNRSKIRKIAQSDKPDDALKTYELLAKHLFSGHWKIYVEEAQYQSLLKNENAYLKTFHYLKPEIFAGFASVTIAGARFRETPLFHLWSANGVEFNSDEQIGKLLRFSKHNGRKHISFYYAFEAHWSKYFRNREDKKALKIYSEAINREMVDKKFLWVANKDIKDSIFDDLKDAERLPNIPHGLNGYQTDYDNFVSLSALNPTSEHYKFLEFMGLASDDLKTAIYQHTIYQCAMRTSIRDPNNEKPKTIIIPDRQTASWLQTIFPGSTVHSLGLEAPFGENKKPARTIQKSNEDRRFAFGKKLALRNQVVLDLVDGKEFDDINENLGHNKSSDNYPFIGHETNLDTPSDQNQCMRLHGTLWERRYDKKCNGYVKNFTHEQFIALLREMSKNEFSSKDKNKLISPAYFVPVEGIETVRGDANVKFVNGIWLDFENGDLTYHKFSKLFPRIRMVAFNTWSHTKEKPRFRIYIPTNRVMVGEEYKNVTSQILDAVKRCGYRNPKKDTQNSHVKAHGIDLSKLGPSNLFYLPCQADEKSSSFFKDLKENRKLLDVQEWLDFGTPKLESEEIHFRGVSDVSASEVKIEDIAPAVERWHAAGILPGNGDSELWNLNRSLRRNGLKGHALRSQLVTAARSAHSPRDRLRQVGRIMNRRNR